MDPYSAYAAYPPPGGPPQGEHSQVGGKRPFAVPPPPVEHQPATYPEEDYDDNPSASSDGDGGDGDFDGRADPSDDDERAGGRGRAEASKGKARGGFAGDAEINPELYGLRRSVSARSSISSSRRRARPAPPRPRDSSHPILLCFYRTGREWTMPTFVSRSASTRW